MIKIAGLTKQYGDSVKALKGIDLEIGRGMFGLVGPNGAGKTTLMRVLAGLIRPTGGRVEILGHDLMTAEGKRAIKALSGYLPQRPGYYPDQTAAEFLDYIAILKGISSRRDRQRQIAELLETVRLDQSDNRRIESYSGGMKQRVGIAQALLGHPKLLIVDEPTAGLDPEARVELRNLLAATAGHCTVILSTHIIEDIGQSCDDVAVLSQGTVLFRGSPRELIARAQGYVWTFTTSGERPDADLTVVSTKQLQDGVQYRVVGHPGEQHQAYKVEPSLEDGYIWLMKQTSKA